jgi:hypothetical protein
VTSSTCWKGAKAQRHLAEVAAKVTEVLADFILMAPPGDQGMLMADVLANLGGILLEKSQDAGPTSPRRSRHWGDGTFARSSPGYVSPEIMMPVRTFPHRLGHWAGTLRSVHAIDFIVSAEISARGLEYFHNDVRVHRVLLRVYSTTAPRVGSLHHIA